MRHSLKTNLLSVIRQNISYYNEIATRYDETLDNDHSNKVIREKVASFFTSLLSSGLVLDFGAGTGKDLAWLMEKDYRVICCEPSVRMREQAMLLNSTNKDIVFLEGIAADFVSWQSHLPFTQKTDAILANFAVINCIPDLPLLFENLSLVCKSGAHLLMLVLKSNLRKKWRSNRRQTLISFLTGETVTTNIHFSGQQQRVYFHTLPKIKKTAANHFQLQHSIALTEGDFVLLHFTRQ